MPLPMRVIGHQPQAVRICRVVHTDLRDVNHAVDTLRGIVRRHDLQNGDGVLFLNDRHTRARMVTVIRGVPLLILFPVSSVSSVLRELFTLAIEWVSRCTITKEAKDELDKELKLAA